MNRRKIIVGVDEVGRGPIAGPVTVGMVVIYKTIPTSKLRGLKDSKKLSAKKRHEWVGNIHTLRSKGYLTFDCVSINATEIDSKGIRACVTKGVKMLVRRLKLHPEGVVMHLDYGISAPPQFTQTQYVKGDERFSEIALASILAKETRDAYMISQARVYPKYGFERHKGYGTLFHRNKVRQYGLSPLHRKTFCTNSFALSRQKGISMGENSSMRPKAKHLPKKSL